MCPYCTSADCESLFRETRRNADYQQTRFLNEVVEKFNRIINDALTIPATDISSETIACKLAYQHPPKHAYKPYIQPVKISDCTPPVTIAYHMLGLKPVANASDEIKQKVNKRLDRLFKRLGNGNIVACNRDYIQYLNECELTQSDITDIHKTFVQTYLQSHCQHNNVFKRWLGFEGQLNKIAKNDNYLIMFHAFANMSEQTDDDLALVKQTVNQLLDEYLKTSWFINSDRRKWAQSLQTKINQASSIDDIIKQLSNSQVDVASKDIAENKRRYFKSIHFFGHSRYQSTLSRAIQLATART